MLFNRVNAKRGAKQIIRQGRPSPLLITIVYLLLTRGITQIVEFFLADPFSQSLQYMMEGYDPMEVYAYVFGGASSVVAIFITILLSLYGIVMAAGYDGYALRLARGQEGTYSHLFDGFGMVMKLIVLNILISLFISFWMMLFVIPGIIASFSYSQAVFCLLDDPDIGPLEAIRRSKAMMRGQKLNFVLVQLSFVGWKILAVVVSGGMGFLFSKILPGSGVAVESTFGILCDVCLMPYMWIVYARFYHELNEAQYRYTGPKVEF